VRKIEEHFVCSGRRLQRRRQQMTAAAADIRDRLARMRRKS
jgi:hypothetical protein